jgi:hypothetical protein
VVAPPGVKDIPDATIPKAQLAPSWRMDAPKCWLSGPTPSGA